MSFIRDFLRDLRTPLYRNAIFLMANTVVASGIGLFWTVGGIREYFWVREERPLTYPQAS